MMNRLSPTSRAATFNATDLGFRSQSSLHPRLYAIAALRGLRPITHQLIQSFLKFIAHPSTKPTTTKICHLICFREQADYNSARANAMIRVLMLDLGDTLVRGDTVLPHVSEALEVLTKFETKSNGSLISRWFRITTCPRLRRRLREIKAIFDAYVALLDKLQLKTFFEPVNVVSRFQLMPESLSLILWFSRKPSERLKLRIDLNDSCSLPRMLIM